MGSDSNRFLFWQKITKFLFVFLVLLIYKAKSLANYEGEKRCKFEEREAVAEHET